MKTPFLCLTAYNLLCRCVWIWRDYHFCGTKTGELLMNHYKAIHILSSNFFLQKHQKPLTIVALCCQVFWSHFAWGTDQIEQTVTLQSLVIHQEKEGRCCKYHCFRAVKYEETSSSFWHCFQEQNVPHFAFTETLKLSSHSPNPLHINEYFPRSAL